MAHNTPDFRTVTLTAANTNYQLSALLEALDADIPVKCAQIGLQFDSGAGADACLVGNSDLSATVFGRRLLATQAFDMGPVESNLLRTDQIWLRSNGAAHTVHVFLLTR